MQEKITSLVQLFDILTDNERIIVDMLRQIIRENLPAGFKEKLSFNVPYFHGKRGVCIIWPASVPRGGINKGVLLGFWQGHLLRDEDLYLAHGTNKKIFYRVYDDPSQINEKAIKKLLKEAVGIDRSFP